jgi:hypothetical protein
MHAEALFAKREAPLVHIEHDAGRTGDLHKLDRRQTDGARADDEHIVARLDPRPVHRVAADGKRLDQGELIVAEFAGNMEFSCGQQHALAEAAVTHDAEGLVRRATIGQPSPARVTFLAVQIRLDRAAVADRDVGHAGTDRQHLDAELVPRNARIGVKRHLAEKPAEVRAADADAVNAEERLARPRRGRFGDFDGVKRLRFFELDGFHGDVAGNRAVGARLRALV